VHPLGNFHPNHMAHRAAANHLGHWLHAQQILD
jgi:hypothetical protein